MSDAIFKNQTELRLALICSANITGATETQVKYQKPPDNDGVKTTGHWDASIATASRGIIYYDILNSTALDESGEWNFWPWVTFQSGKSAPGKAHKEMIYEEGE